MLHSKKIVCVIPARLASSRFPEKVLITLQNKPLLQWVWEAAKSVPFFDKVVFAIDAEETASLIDSFQGSYHMTPPSLASGSDRVAYIQAQGLEKGDIWVCWQADEPFIKQRMIEDLLQSIQEADSEEEMIWTLKKRIDDFSEVTNPHIAKVVTDKNGCALYISRSPIPHYRDETDNKEYFKHVGLYAYSAAALKKIPHLQPCIYEEAEKLEQLRFLFNHIPVKMHSTEELAFGIDLPQHQTQAEQIIQGLLARG